GEDRLVTVAQRRIAGERRLHVGCRQLPDERKPRDELLHHLRGVPGLVPAAARKRKRAAHLLDERVPRELNLLPHERPRRGRHALEVPGKERGADRLDRREYVEPRRQLARRQRLRRARQLLDRVHAVSSNSQVLRYRSPVSGSTTTMRLRALSGRAAISSAACSAAPLEIPARIPSSRASCRATRPE